jgi:hypothetical protein
LHQGEDHHAVDDVSEEDRQRARVDEERAPAELDEPRRQDRLCRVDVDRQRAATDSSPRHCAMFRSMRIDSFMATQSADRAHPSP